LAKPNRAHRLVQIMRTLAAHPGELLPLGFFAERFGAAKSSISEDLALVKQALESEPGGHLRTVAGAAGGVQFWPLPSQAATRETLLAACEALRSPDRALPGGYWYMTDIVSSPVWSARLGEIFAAKFLETQPTLVLTVETKGIPLALMTARALGVPLVIARREGRVTEGPSVSINYVTSSRRIQTMTVAKRSLPRDARVLVIDDFMKAGATARGLVDLVTEFEGTVVGVGVFVTTKEPVVKMVSQYTSLLTLEGVDSERRQIFIRPTEQEEA
jgi:purine operon repressor